jgi:hypothetical protein
MESAFGVDHGSEEISKLGLKPPGMGTLKPMVQGMQSAFKMGAQGVHGPAASVGAGRAMGAGAMTRKVGQFGMKNKKPLAIGAGAAGAGAAGGMLTSRRRF